LFVYLWGADANLAVLAGAGPRLRLTGRRTRRSRCLTPFADPGTTYVAVLDGATGSYKITSLSALVAATTQMDQHITDAGPVSVLPNAGIVRVDQSAGAAITLNMPLASVKTCPVLISDWKGDAATNNITISLTGSDKFPGGLTSWTIAADTGSVFLRPVPGAGYAL
jgi:hypothetical protein